MPVEAVDVELAAAAVHARQVVGKSGPHPGADLQDLRLAERRVQGVGRAEQLQHRARGDARRLVALDHGRADHVMAVAARNDVDGHARMQHPHRPREADVREPDEQHLALDAAQVRQLIARGEPAAVDHGAIPPRRRGGRLPRGLGAGAEMNRWRRASRAGAASAGSAARGSRCPSSGK